MRNLPDPHGTLISLGLDLDAIRDTARLAEWMERRPRETYAEWEERFDLADQAIEALKPIWAGDGK